MAIDLSPLSVAELEALAVEVQDAIKAKKAAAKKTAAKKTAAKKTASKAE